MAHHVRGHYRKDGSYVRPHTRRSRPASGRIPSPRRAPEAQALPETVRTTRVRGHYRANGSYVRAHHRQIGTPAVVAAGGSGLLAVVVLLILAALGGGGGGATQAPTPSAPVSVAPGLPR
ncbi:hypothetical protein [Streptomyces sp. cmx-10-25]|uniref:hypothetical protein n=1 Tax=Streptomyces sp. cmx-10-25 TaxID=2790919 RepID=UPI00398156D1